MNTLSICFAYQFPQIFIHHFIYIFVHRDTTFVELTISSTDSVSNCFSKSESQIDVAILDFLKAFDTVLHAGSLRNDYGIDIKVLI